MTESSLRVYKRIVFAIIEDGEVNPGRLYVLYVLIQTYCAEYKDRACDIWTAYNRVVEGSTARKSEKLPLPDD
jgi:hypothetical protein